LQAQTSKKKRFINEKVLIVRVDKKTMILLALGRKKKIKNIIKAVQSP